MEYLEILYQRHKHNGILVDSNLLLVYAIGLFDPHLIANFKRTNNYTIQDFDLLRKLLGLFSRVLTTPNILTEVSNLSSSLNNQWAEFLASFKKLISVLDERSMVSQIATTDPAFANHGLTDGGIGHILRTKNCLLITDDLPMYSFLCKKLDIVNFTHLRTAQWL